MKRAVYVEGSTGSLYHANRRCRLSDGSQLVYICILLRIFQDVDEKREASLMRNLCFVFFIRKIYQAKLLSAVRRFYHGRRPSIKARKAFYSPTSFLRSYKKRKIYYKGKVYFSSINPVLIITL